LFPLSILCYAKMVWGFRGVLTNTCRKGGFCIWPARAQLLSGPRQAPSGHRPKPKWKHTPNSSCFVHLLFTWHKRNYGLCQSDTESQISDSKHLIFSTCVCYLRPFRESPSKQSGPVISLADGHIKSHVYAISNLFLGELMCY